MRRPRNGLEPFGFDRLTVDDATPECSVLDPLQRVADLFQGRRIELGNGKVHTLVLVGDAVVRRIARRIKDLLPSLLPLVRNMTRETLLKVEQSLFVLLNSHGCSSSGRVARNALRIILFDGIGRDNPEQFSRAPLDAKRLGMVRGTCHLPAGFSAAPALLCAFVHNLVVWKSFATHSARIAHLGADLTDTTMRQ